MKTFTICFCIFAVALSGLAANQTAKPKLQMAPSGHETPKEPPASSGIEKVASASQLASLLEKRWTVENIRSFRVPETRFCTIGSIQNPY